MVASYKTAILMAIEVAIITLRTTPGYVCRTGSKPHAERLAQREAALQHIENELKRGVDDAAPLFAAREQLLRIDTDMRRRKYVQTAIRAMSIIAVPYSPLASALFAAIDLFGVSAALAIKDFYMSDILSLLRDTVERVQDLEVNIQDKLAQVKELRDHLEALKAKIELAQRRPIAGRLSDVLDTLCAVKTAVEGALSLPCDGCDSRCAPVPVPMREVVKAYKDIAEALEAPSMISGSIVDLSEEECGAVDGLLSLCRTVPDSTPPSSD
ncbi:hypothetical protein C8Q80DRAFT_272818 [Daedaleopsis nitida]|nr:hypothetical protein C8Q80DRAFT_272818 [Daedaleopsis nitida]